jgi:hypothetical protein
MGVAMNTQTGNLDLQNSRAFDEAIDLLVLNELPVPDQRNLIERLDRTENGWRRCAIAFIENQRMGNALCAVAGGRDAAMEFVFVDLHKNMGPFLANDPSGVGRAGVGTIETRPKAHLCWAIAATFALIGGFLFGRFDGGSVQPRESGSNEMAFAVDARGSNDVLDKEALRQIAWAHTAVGEKDFQVVAMVHASTDLGDRYFPIVASSRLEQRLNALPRPGLSPEVSALMKKDGWQVDKHRQLLSMQTPDGNYTLTPLDLFSCRYVGKATY